jgi:hypothetical protein
LNGGDYGVTEREILNMRISRIVINLDKVEITLARPGLLIGKRGLVIDGLAEYLGKGVKVIEDRDCITDFLVPVNLDDFDDIYDRELYLHSMKEWKMMVEESKEVEYELGKFNY